jgi:hypothetical protein
MSAIFSASMMKASADCDERIAFLQSKIDSWSAYKGVMGLMERMFEGEDKKVFSEAPQLDNVKQFENNMSLVKIEKMIYNALSNSNSNKKIFKMLLAKYDELLGVSYDVSGNMVINGIVPEGDYIDYCKKSLTQREYIRKICSMGEQL